MKIAGFHKNSTIDYPGKFSCVVFVADCNYRCYYCHNKHLFGARDVIPREEIYDFLLKRKGLIEGVVVTGGEPTIYDDLPLFIEKIKSIGYAVKLDTNGSHPQMVKKLVDSKRLDFIAVDFKAPFHKYDMIGACEEIAANETKVTETINFIMKSDLDYEIRVTMIPEITEKDLLEMAKKFPNAKNFVLQRYRPDGSDLKSDGNNGENRVIGMNTTYGLYDKEDIERLSTSIISYQPNIAVRA